MMIPLLALLSAALFAGAALYITLVEHPARLFLDDSPLLQHWQSNYKRALPVRADLVWCIASRSFLTIAGAEPAVISSINSCAE